jgi:hypothetical protein
MRLNYILLSIAVCGGALLTAAQPARRVAAPFKPAIRLDNKPVEYPGTANSLKDIDFKNFTYKLSDRGDDGRRVRNGKYESRAELSFDGINVGDVWLFGQQNGQPGYALVTIYNTYGGGSSNEDLDVLLYTVRNHRLVLVQQMTVDAQAPGVGVVFTPATKALTIKARSNDNSAHCCAEHLDVIHLHWTGSGFAVTDARRVPAPKTK